MDAPETSRPKLALANSNANLLRPAGANRAGPTEITLTLRGCAVRAGVTTATARFVFDGPRGLSIGALGAHHEQVHFIEGDLGDQAAFDFFVALHSIRSLA